MLYLLLTLVQYVFNNSSFYYVNWHPNSKHELRTQWEMIILCPSTSC